MPAHIGSKNPQAKLTEQQVREIYASTETQRVTARRYGVTQSLVSQIRNRQVWAHLWEKSAS